MVLENRTTNRDNNANSANNGANNGNQQPVGDASSSAYVTMILALFLKMMYLVTFLPNADEHHLTYDELFFAYYNSISNEDLINIAGILEAFNKLLSDGFAVLLPSGKIQLSALGLAQARSNNNGTVTVADARRARGLCLDPQKYFILSELAANGGTMDEAELEARFNEHFGVEAEVPEALGVEN